MKLYLLTNPAAGYDRMVAVLVRAISVEAARNLAAPLAGDEGKEIWLNPKLSTCEVIRVGGKPGPIISDFHSA